MAKSTAKKAADKPSSKSTAVAVRDKDKLPSNAMDAMAALSGRGLENVGAKDVIIPRIAVLQQLSPQLQKSKPEFIKGAKVGDICNTASQTLYDKLTVIPVHYELIWPEWAPRKSDKGLITIHATDECLVDCEKNEDGQWENEAGNIIIETAQFYVLLASDNFKQAFISFQKTQRKKAKRWMTMITDERPKDSKGREFVPPLFYRSYELDVGEESNKQGEWFGWRIERGKAVVEMDNYEEIIRRCLNFQEAVFQGKAKANMENDRTVGDSGAM